MLSSFDAIPRDQRGSPAVSSWENYRCDVLAAGHVELSHGESYEFVNSKRMEYAGILQITLDGFGVFQEDGKEEQLLRSGDAFLIQAPSATRYAIKQGCAWRFVYIYFNGDMALKHIQQINELRGYVFQVQEEHTLVKSCQAVLRAVIDAQHDAYLLSGLLYTCLMNCYPRMQDQQMDNPLLQAQDYIEQHLADKHLSVAQIAESVGKSQYHFSRLFKQYFAEAPYAYVMKMRIQRALELMNTTSLNNGEIAKRCGFNDGAHFSNVFKRQVGSNPSVYRKFGSI